MPLYCHACIADGSALVADFGIAKDKASPAQSTANLHDGTAPYKVGSNWVHMLLGLLAGPDL
jgi:hypothetical protein